MMPGKANPPGALWRCWQRTATRRTRAPLLVDAASGNVFRAAEITAAAETVFRGGGMEAISGCVAWILPNGLDWLAIFLATQKAGCAALPLDPGFAADQGRESAARLGATHWWNGKTLELLTSTLRRWPKVAVVKLTSGTTGAARPIRCAARHLLADYAHIRAGMGLRPGDKNLGLIPFGHSYGLGNLVLPLLVDGIGIVSSGAYSIAQIREWCEIYRPTVFPSVPVVWRLLAESAGPNRLGGLRLAISAGAPLPPEVAQSFYRHFGRRLHNFYGASQTGGIAYDRTGRAGLTARSVGHPLPGVRVSFRRNRVVVCGPAVAVGGGRHVLPDCGHWNSHGELVLTGRVGRHANIAGRKVALREIEMVLRSLSGVSDAWCGLGSARGRDYVVAAVETAREVAAVEQAATELLPAWKRPRAWLALAEFPRTARGKTDTRVLALQLGL
jgi:acyl-coenzyme A synthetase/AMP-(fatty) acid ligase